ncbi:hypothetical protein [Geoalkalibacter subterraneus]|uniref:Uncharacterized protein n=1 Tax=Geoalkalibacter subterraneus TaxID=483547 RepID=A0A0B5FVK5_9BACT|nr:hypothetical protein [Geoalkalibacter subterraneus]AJF08200.1 hypothetical protein GSUB_17065 [Geoalkalibacter subterraneus]
MGYQESYVTTVDPQKFDSLVEDILARGQDFWRDERFLNAVEIIEIQKTVTAGGHTFPPGSRFVYVVGERQYQRSTDTFESERSGDVVIYWTEMFPSEEIFEENSEFARHEPFPWDTPEEDLPEG